ncbi:MAG: hypothetical protein JNK82_02710 [Myxococcaceae bacterium]|nr:hypothetical protein [Myxococcaceae bacterium]
MALAMHCVRRMVETVLTIPRGAVIPGALLGATCGVVLGRLGWPGLLFTFPMLALVTFATTAELSTRKLSTAVMAFIAACIAMAAVLR